MTMSMFPVHFNIPSSFKQYFSLPPFVVKIFLNPAFVGHRLVCTWFLKIYFVHKIGICVCPSPRLITTSGLMWHDMNPI